MNNSKIKYNAMLLALCMVLTAFVAVVSMPVGADQVSSGGTFEIYWLDSWMEDDPDLAGVDEEIVFNYDDNQGNLYYLGDEGAEIQLRMRNNEVDDIWNVYITLVASDPIIAGVPDNRWPASGDYGDPGTVFSGGSPGEWIDDNPGSAALQGEPWFTIDIATSGAVNTLYPNALQVTINYEDAGGPDSDTFSFDIFISSVFDRDASDAQRDEHDDLPFIDETDSDDEFEAGVLMQEGEFSEDNWAGFAISDVEATISGLPTGISLSGGYATAINPGPITANGGDLDLYWRFNVNSDVAPGFYDFDIAFTYVRDDTGETITESARGSGLYVDFTPRLIARLQSPVEITQNELEAELDVIFTNAGNVPLNDLTVRVVPDGDWLDIAFHHYENDDDVYESEVAIGDLAVGADSSALTVMVATNMMLPNGSHRVPFAWSGWVFEDGSTGEASRWVMNGGEMYNHDSNSATPEVERLYEDNNENRRYDGGDSTVESAWDGAFVDFGVLDDNGLTWEAIIWDTVEAGVDGEVRFTTLEVTLYNMELVDFKDLVVTMDVGPDTPFLNPIVDMHDSTTPIMMDADSDTTIDADDDATIYFTVDVNSAWWQTNSLDPETYTIDLTVSATNDDNELRVEDVTIPAVVNIDGFGPELFASLVSYTKIKPGNTFDLSITITNFGDDIAREVDAYLRADFVRGWSIVDQFTTSIGAYGGYGDNPEIGDASWGWEDEWDQYTQFNRTHDIRPGEIGVESVPQIVELNDWIRRRETPPQGIILWLHLDRLGPGETHTFQFEMVSDVNMVEGMVYYEVLELYYVDSNGETYGPEGDPVGNVEDHYAPPQEVLVRAGKGEKYDADAMDFSVVLYAIIFLIIAFIVFLIGYALGGRGGRERSEPEPAPFEDYEQEYVPPPEEDMGPPEPEEDLGPPPEPDEEKPLE